MKTFCAHNVGLPILVLHDKQNETFDRTSQNLFFNFFLYSNIFTMKNKKYEKLKLFVRNPN